MSRYSIGQHFILGFRGDHIPDWLKHFADQFSLAGVILFDYNCQTKEYDDNIKNPDQLMRLCTEIHQLPGRPLIYIDQEGGKVRRLKESKGFKPLPSQEAMNQFSKEERLFYLKPAFQEMKELGIDVNLAPVVDLNFNPENPDIGKVERSYSSQADKVIENFQLINQVACDTKVGLCLKHFPGLGGATVNSHWELTDISDSIDETQLQLFDQLVKEIFGHSTLVSHGMINQWDPEAPASISPIALAKLRASSVDALILTDDIQMHGLQKKMSTLEACKKALSHEVDLICLGNNILDEQDQMISLAQNLNNHFDSSETFLEKHNKTKNRLKCLRQLL